VTTNELLAAGYRMGHQVVHLMCDDLTEEEFRHQPIPGANSAAWIVGHLAVTARRTAERVGATGLPALTEEYVGLFSATKKPAGMQTDLGTKAELFALLDVSVGKLVDAVRQLPPESLHAPAPNRLPLATNYGEALLFGALHFTLHCGHLSTIRRSLGKPPGV
jgi:hypothetical protein